MGNIETKQGHTQAQDQAKGAARSTQVTVKNKSSVDLARVEAGLAHGIWSKDSFPPETIVAGDTVSFQTESDGFMTGTEGKAKYYAVSHGIVALHWDNPYSGSNKYDVDVPSGIHASTSGGGGNNAHWEVTITDG